MVSSNWQNRNRQMEIKKNEFVIEKKKIEKWMNKQRSAVGLKEKRRDE